MALTVRGDEDDALLAKLPDLTPVMLLLDVPDHLSRLHAGQTPLLNPSA